MQRGALYLRSSKDRTDISIETQRARLTELATSKKTSIVVEFSDVVESGKDEDRDGFQELTVAIKNRQRGWNVLFMLDTARLARNRFSAAWIKHDCKRYGVEIVFANMVDIDPVTKILVEAIFEGVDEWHSAISREKALAGMRTNIRKGWRAGGRAPTGYQLQHEPTGAIRDGKPVLKSKLIPSADARVIANYLKLRSHGMPRKRLIRDTGIGLSVSTLITIEWNALVYAGHTVWNRHYEKKHRGSGQPKRRPRTDWVIEKNTHEALITDTEAESILRQLQTSTASERISRGKAGVSSYLLSGILLSPSGQRWVGSGVTYRLKSTPETAGRRVSRDQFERTVLAQITSDMRSEAFMEALASHAKQSGLAADPTAPLRAEVAKLEREKTRAANLALTVEDSGTFARLVEERSRQISALQHEIAAKSIDEPFQAWITGLTAAKVKELMMELGSAAAVLRTYVDRIILHPNNDFEIHYRSWKSEGLLMASPKGFEPLLPP